MRRILAGSSLIAAVFVWVAPVRAAQAPPEHRVSTVVAFDLLRLAPDPTVIALAELAPVTAAIYTIAASAVGSGTISPNGNVVVTPGANQKFTMAPLPCVLLGNVRVDGVDLGPLATYTFQNMNSNHTIEANFIPAPPDTIVASAGPGGTISPAGATVYSCGDAAIYTITANECFLIGDVRVDGISQGAAPSFTFNYLQGSHTIVASFVPGEKLTVSATAGFGGTITPSGSVKVACGADQTFTIAPSSCNQITDVRVDGVSQGAVSSYTLTNVRASHTIAASFAFAATTDTITAIAGAGGTIVPSGAVVVGCSSSQKFTIAHDACYRIADVVVDGVSQGAVSSYVFTDLKTSHTIAASFASSPQYTITASSGVGGTISPAGSIQVDCGASQTFTMTPDVGNHIVSLLVDGLSQDPLPSYTFTSVNDAHAIAVHFSSETDIHVIAIRCSSSQIRPVVLGGPLRPNTTYSFDVQPLDCAPPTPGTVLASAGSILTDDTGTIVATHSGCFILDRYSLIIDVLGSGVFVPQFDPVACFAPNVATAATGIQDLEGELTPEGASLSWWVMDLSTYSGFLVHRAPEGGDEVLVTSVPLAPPSTHPPAQMRWRDGAAAPGTRYSYRIEALKTGGSDWYGPVSLLIPVAPPQLALRSATPNPFHGATRLALDMPSGEGELRLDVFDVAGRHVRTLRRGTMPAGQDVVDWDGLDDRGAPARGGLYMVRLQDALWTSVLRIMKFE